MGSATGVDIQPRLGLRPSRRLLRHASDERLVQQIRRGSDGAFEVAFERHSPAILGFCRHMLGSPEEAEDAVQHTFAAAYGDLRRAGEREIALKPWLFAIARNRCLSLLRARREQAMDEPELVTAGLAEEVERRAELRQLLADLRELPDDQREALLLAETAGLPQVEIAAVLGCEVHRVKGLVYRARSALVARREARELACQDVRQQLANLRGGSLRRNELRLHLRECAGCRDFGEQVRHQRSLLSAALPVAPTLGLKANVLAAVGIGGAGGGAAVVGGAGVAGGAAGAGTLGGAAKVAALAAIAIGGVGGGAAVVVSQHHHSTSPGKPAARGTVERAPAGSSERGESVAGVGGATTEAGRRNRPAADAHVRHPHRPAGAGGGRGDRLERVGGGPALKRSDDASGKGVPADEAKPGRDKPEKEPGESEGEAEGNSGQGHQGSGHGAGSAKPDDAATSGDSGQGGNSDLGAEAEQRPQPQQADEQGDQGGGKGED